MDNITHTLTGFAIARVGGKRLGAYATPILLLAVNAPDLDVISALGGSTTYLHWHRGITHSFAAAPVLALIITALFVAGRKWKRSEAEFSPLRAFLVALGGIVIGHLFLDWSTSYGTRLLLPFSGRWLAWDAIPILDIWLLVALIAGLVIPFLFRLVSEEIGAQTRSNRGGAIFALVFLAAWFGFRGVCHTRAVAQLESHIYHGLDPQQVGAFADLTNPFLWHGVVTTTDTMEMVQVNVLDDFDPTHTRVYYRPEASPALAAARQTYIAGLFLEFARFPYAYVEPSDEGYRVIIRDLRFENSVTGAKGFVVQVLENRELRVTGQSFSFRPQGTVR